MSDEKRKSSRERVIGIGLLLLLLAALLPLSDFLAGLLPGGGRLPTPERGATEPNRPGTLQVTVLRAEDRLPLVGARILVEGLTGGESDARSDAQGRATLSGLGDGPVRIEATFEGRTAETWADTSVSSEIQLAVGPERKRAGVVRYADGAPARAHVRLLDHDGAELASTETDAEGRYELPDEPGAAAVCAVAERGAPASAREGNLVIAEGEEVAGRIAGAKEGVLKLYGLIDAPSEDWMLPMRASWKVEADGTFRGRAPAGARMWGLYDGLPVRVGAGEVKLPQAAAAIGRVRKATGAPAARAVLLFRPQLDSDFAAPLPGLRVQTDENGHFEAEGFASIPYTVEVRGADCATRIVEGIVPGGEEIEIEIEPGYAVSGFVIDTKGLPVARARIQAAGLPEANGDRPVANGYTDSKGRFHLDGLGGEFARVRVTAPGYHATSLERVGKTATLRVVLQRAGFAGADARR